MIETRGLEKSYGKRRALDALDLKVAPGELVVLLGRNGAGKTTTLAMLTGQLVPDAGSALIAGHDVFSAAEMARSLVGYVGQELLLPPHLTLDEAVEFACAVKGVTRDPLAFDQLLKLAALQDDADRLMGELSHGMQRKAAWIVALITEPQALILDEGLAGLDAASSAALAAEVGRRVARGTAVLWTEHDLALVAPLAHRAVVLDAGRVVEQVQREELQRLVQDDQLDAAMRRWTGEAT